KAGTLAVMFALPLFLLADSIRTGHDVALGFAWFFTVSGLAFGYYATVTYVPLARRALQEGRDGRSASQAESWAG
ncbi:MAG TPA: hypothetical protein VGA11_04320, partial [Acidimicrobiia bacterium]